MLEFLCTETWEERTILYILAFGLLVLSSQEVQKCSDINIYTINVTNQSQGKKQVIKFLFRSLKYEKYQLILFCINETYTVGF